MSGALPGNSFLPAGLRQRDLEGHALTDQESFARERERGDRLYDLAKGEPKTKGPKMESTLPNQTELLAKLSALLSQATQNPQTVLRYCLLDVCAELEVFWRISGRSAGLA